MQQENSDLYKIGVTKKEIWQRILELQTGNPKKIVMLKEFETKWDYKLESYLHGRFKNKSCSGEWFQLTDEEIETFIPLCEKGEGIFNLLKSYDNPFI